MFAILRVCAAGLLFVGCSAAVQVAPTPSVPSSPTVSEAAPSAQQAVPPDTPQLTEIPGKATAERLCSQCHTLESVTNQRRTREEWNGVIERMIGQGLVAPEEELYEVSDYLTKYYGPPAS